MIGQGGGQERGGDEIGGTRVLFSQGGGHAGVVFVVGVYSPLLYRFQFWFWFWLWFW